MRTANIRTEFGTYLASGVLFVLTATVAQGQPIYGQDFFIESNFTASDSTVSQSGFIPPDTMGAVGPNHIGVLINGRWSVYDRSGALQEGQSLNNFWNDAGITPDGSFAFDPRVLYDPVDQRWYACSVDNGGNANNFLVAVSDNSDPTEGWTGFKIDSDSDDAQWADFPTMGVNDDMLVIAANMFPTTSGGSTYTSVLVLPKDELNSGAVGNRTLFEDIDPNDTGFAIQPVFDLDNSAGSLSLLSAYNKPSGFLKQSAVDGPANSPTLDTVDRFIAVTSRDGPGDIDQPGTKEDVDAGDTRFSGNVVLQGGSLWGVHSVLDPDGLAAIEWYQIDEATSAVLQNGLITQADLPAAVADPDMEFNYPSISVNDLGEAVIGFSAGSPNRFISTGFVYGTTSGGVTSFSDIVFSQNGLATYEILDNGGRNRWGDYSATVIDPLNPRSFWTFQEFVLSEDVWAVKVTQIVIPEPSALALLALGATAALGLRRRHTGLG